jgi:hypothetical protein
MFAGRGRFAFPWRNRRRARRDEGSMPLALLVTLVGVTLSAGLSGLVVGQLRDSQRVSDRVAAVNAAQAGLDAGLARIRGSITALAGDLTKLPCSVMQDTVSQNSARYRVSIGYFLVDPSGMANALAPIGDLTNLNQLTAGTPVDTLLTSLGQTVTGPLRASLDSAVQSAVGCVSGVLKQVPLYGLLRSTGTVGGVSRTLYATYTFRTTEETIPGGHIVIAGTSNQLCMGAGIRADGKAPQSGDPVLAVPCTGADDQLKFIYPRNLSLSLSKSRTTKAAGVPYGLCITALVQVNDAPAIFEPCAATKTPSQQWQYEVNQQTYYGTVDGSNRSGYCLNMQSPGVVNSPIVLRNGGNCGSAGASGKAFVPDANVGSGAAGINTGQLVNFAEVGRCLDLTEEDPKGGYFTSRGLLPALITYPCKQSFTGSVFWNHKWSAPAIPKGDYRATGQVSTTPDRGSYIGNAYCLNSPGPSGGYVWVGLCSANTPAMQWTVYEAAPLANEAYQVVDNWGHCLEAAGSLGPAYQYKTWSEVIVTTCDGSGIQKWNAPRSLGLGPLTGIQER